MDEANKKSDLRCPECRQYTYGYSEGSWSCVSCGFTRWDKYTFVDARVVADYLSLDIGTIRNWTYTKIIPSYPVNKKMTRYRLIDIEKWMEKFKVHPESSGH